MRLTPRTLIAVATAAASFALPQIANADRVYYLVGVRHIYKIGTDKYYRADERKQIEEDYADECSADNSHYQYRIAHGGDRADESRQLASALHDLAEERENRLAALYPRTDYVRRGHRQFDITVDGPYQVIGVDYHVARADPEVPIYDDYVAYAPWPGYAAVGPEPYGWSYGVVYAPTAFVNVYNGWYGGWVGFGCPAFVGFYGFGGPIVCAGLSVNVGIGVGFGFSAGFGVGFGGFFVNPGLGGFYHAGPGYFARDVFAGRYIASRTDPRGVMAARAGFASGSSAIRSARAMGFASGIRAGSRSTFAASAGRPTAAGSFRAGTGYAHSAIGARNGGSFARTGAARGSTAGRTAGSARSFASSGRSSGYAHGFSGGHSTASGRTAGSSHGSFSGRTSSSGRSSFGSSSARRSSGGHSSFSGGRSSVSSGRGSFGGGGHSSFGGARSSGGGGGRSSGGGGRRRGG